MKNGREVRALALVTRGGQIRRLDAHTFRVRSQSGNGTYLVIEDHGEWGCECPDFRYRNVKCKHILAVKFWLALREKIISENVEGISRKNLCPYCSSSDVKKNGCRKTKVGSRQRFLCKTCGKAFMLDEPFKRLIGNPKIVSMSLDLYFKGVSLRKITHHIQQFYGLKIAHTTVYNWIKRYMKLINAYVERLEPKLSAVWHVDEMMVKAGGKWVWLWNVMDKETRFLLCSLISRKREVSDARKVFQEAKKRAGCKPKAVVTDGLPAYIKAFKKEFFTLRKPRIKHVRMPRFTDSLNNNLVERLHGTIRDRDKVMRGMKSEMTGQELIDGLRAYYNFIRPHLSLNGKTPAEEAGINLNLEENKWLSLIEKAYSNLFEQPS